MNDSTILTQQVEAYRDHYQSRTVAVTIPAVQAAVSGLATGAAGTVIFAAMSWLFHWPPALVDRLAYALLFGAVVALVTVNLHWFRALQIWRAQVDLLLPYTEPDPLPAESLRLEIHADRKTQLVELPDISAGALQALAAGLLAGQPLAERNWTGAGKPFSQSQLRAIRSTFLSKGWIVWNLPGEPRQGTSLTRTGADLCRALVEQHPSKPAHHLPTYRTSTLL